MLEKFIAAKIKLLLRKLIKFYKNKIIVLFYKISMVSFILQFYLSNKIVDKNKTVSAADTKLSIMLKIDYKLIFYVDKKEDK